MISIFIFQKKAGAKFGHLRKQCWEPVWFHRKGTLPRRVMNGRLPVELWRPSCFPFCSFIPCPGASCGCEVRNLLSISIYLYLYLSIIYLYLSIIYLLYLYLSLSIYILIFISISISISSSYLSLYPPVSRSVPSLPPRY